MNGAVSRDESTAGAAPATSRRSGGGRRADVHDARFAQAIENALLATEAARARDRLAVLARLGELATIELNTHARLDAVVQSVLPAFADACAVHLLDYSPLSSASGSVRTTTA